MATAMTIPPTSTMGKNTNNNKLARQNHSIVSNDVDASLYNGCWLNRWRKNCHHKHAHKSTMPFGNSDQVHGAQSKSTLYRSDDNEQRPRQTERERLKQCEGARVRKGEL